MVPELMIVLPAPDNWTAATPTLLLVMVPVLVIVVPAPDTIPAVVPEMAPELVIVVPVPDLIPSPLADEIMPELLIELSELCRNKPGAPVSDEIVPKLLTVKPFWLPVP